MRFCKKVLSSIIMVVILMLVGCFGPGVADYNYNLSGDFKLYHAGTTDIADEGNSSKIIIEDVGKVAWNNSFICVEELSKSDTYWIIDVASKEVLGPLTYSRFEELRKEFGIWDLELKNPREYNENN